MTASRYRHSYAGWSALRIAGILMILLACIYSMAAYPVVFFGLDVGSQVPSSYEELPGPTVDEKVKHYIRGINAQYVPVATGNQRDITKKLIDNLQQEIERTGFKSPRSGDTRLGPLYALYDYYGPDAPAFDFMDQIQRTAPPGGLEANLTRDITTYSSCVPGQT